MTDTELAEKYTRVVQTSLGQWVQAMVVKKKPSGGSPEIVWKGVGRMLPIALPENVAMARLGALKDRRFFRTCAACNQIRPAALILNSGACPECDVPKTAA